MRLRDDDNREKYSNLTIRVANATKRLQFETYRNAILEISKRDDEPIVEPSDLIALHTEVRNGTHLTAIDSPEEYIVYIIKFLTSLF